VNGGKKGNRMIARIAPFFTRAADSDL